MHVDETGWRTGGEGRALWTATTPEATFLQIAKHCDREQFDALIGAYAGIVVSDRGPGDEHLDPALRQVCWSHLQRDFRRHSEGPAEQKTFGEHGLQLTRQLFTAWRAYQRDHHDRQQLQAEIGRPGPSSRRESRVSGARSAGRRPELESPPARAPIPPRRGTELTTSGHREPRPEEAAVGKAGRTRTARIREIMLATRGEQAAPGLRTLQRHRAREGLTVRADGRLPGKVYGRFEATVPNDEVDR